ncbi:MAG: hypothetical protein NVS2B4_18690 [Ramlibacter sp.]
MPAQAAPEMIAPSALTGEQKIRLTKHFDECPLVIGYRARSKRAQGLGDKQTSE